MTGLLSEYLCYEIKLSFAHRSSFVPKAKDVKLTIFRALFISSSVKWGWGHVYSLAVQERDYDSEIKTLDRYRHVQEL